MVGSIGSKQLWALGSKDLSSNSGSSLCSWGPQSGQSPFWALVSWPVIRIPTLWVAGEASKRECTPSSSPDRKGSFAGVLFCSYWDTQPPGEISRSPLEKGFFWRSTLNPGVGTAMLNMKSVRPYPWFVRDDWVGRAQGGDIIQQRCWKIWFVTRLWTHSLAIPPWASVSPFVQWGG